MLHHLARGRLRRRSVLGRETAIQGEWRWRDDGWLYVKNVLFHHWLWICWGLEMKVFIVRRREIPSPHRKATTFPFHSFPVVSNSTPKYQQIFKIQNNKLVLIRRSSISSWFAIRSSQRQTHLFRRNHHSLLRARR